MPLALVPRRPPAARPKGCASRPTHHSAAGHDEAVRTSTVSTRAAARSTAGVDTAGPEDADGREAAGGRTRGKAATAARTRRVHSTAMSTNARTTRPPADLRPPAVSSEDADRANEAGEGSLPVPKPHRMGNQVRVQHRVYGYHLPDPDAQPRGNNRYILCGCGWIVQLNATGRAHARLNPRRAGVDRYAGEVGEHEAASACTNFVCTGRADHRRHRKKHAARQKERRAAIAAGTAVLVTLTDDFPADTSPLACCRLGL